MKINKLATVRFYFAELLFLLRIRKRPDISEYSCVITGRTIVTNEAVEKIIERFMDVDLEAEEMVDKLLKKSRAKGKFKPLVGERETGQEEIRRLKAEIAMLKGRTLSGEIDFGENDRPVPEIIGDTTYHETLKGDFPEGERWNSKSDLFPTDEPK